MPLNVCQQFWRLCATGSASAFIKCALLIGVVAVSIGAVTIDYQARRDKLKTLSAAQRQQLNDKFEQFQKLTPERKAQLRKLETDLAADPQGEELRKVLLRYNEWLKTLLPGDRAELLQAEPEKRIARIVELKNRQEQERWRAIARPQPVQQPNRQMFDQAVKAGEALQKWTRDYVAKHEDELLSDLKGRDELPDKRREAIEKDAGWRFHTLRWLTAERFRSNKIDQADFDALFKALPEDSRTFLHSKKDENEQRLVIGGWIMMRGRTDFVREAAQDFRNKHLTDEEKKKVEEQPLRDRDRFADALLKAKGKENPHRYGGRPRGSRGWPQGEGGRREEGPPKGGPRPEGPPNAGPRENGPRDGNPGRGNRDERGPNRSRPDGEKADGPGPRDGGPPPDRKGAPPDRPPPPKPTDGSTDELTDELTETGAKGSE